MPQQHERRFLGHCRLGGILFVTALMFCSTASTAVAQKSLVIGIDGLGYGVRGLGVARVPNIDSLRDGSWADGYRGASTDESFVGGWSGTSTLQPTVSGPGWSTILTGVWKDKHGVTNNSFSNSNYGDNPPYLETLEEQIAELYSASIVNWGPIDSNIIAAVDDADSQMDFRRVSSNDNRVARDAISQISSIDSNLPAAVFVSFDEVDAAGHACGSSGTCYQAEIGQVDGLVGQMLSAVTSRPDFADENWQIIVTSDHGHKARGGHGGRSDVERRVPFVVSSQSLAQGVLHAGTAPDVSHADVAPTVLEHFGMDLPVRYAGESHAAGGKPPLPPPLPKTLVFSEDFETLQLGPNVEEDIANPMDNVWTKNAPPNWQIMDEVPGQDERPDNNGVTEWIGWSFADKDWWAQVAGDQGRSEFSLGSGTVAIADPDEWDDADHPDSATEGWYNTFLSTPNVSLEGLEPGSVTLEFASSWRDEFDSNYRQTANINVSFDGGPPVEVMRWESDPGSDNFHDDATDESVQVSIDNPKGAASMVLSFGLFDAGNDWWWAIDNVKVLGRVWGDFNADGVVDVQDVDQMAQLIISGDDEADLNGDGEVDIVDRKFLIGDIMQTWMGDANLDGLFDSDDMLLVFQAGLYETEETAGWTDGDWNGDRVFGSSDLIVALEGGGYEIGPREAVKVVPEPTSLFILAAGLVGIAVRRRAVVRG